MPSENRVHTSRWPPLQNTHETCICENRKRITIELHVLKAVAKPCRLFEMNRLWSNVRLPAEFRHYFADGYLELFELIVNDQVTLSQENRFQVSSVEKTYVTIAACKCYVFI